MENKLITTIITTYKRSSLLDRAIQSVLNQTYSNIEVIVVDDNESNTIHRKEVEKLMNKYNDNDSVNYIKHSRNMNGANARNTGLKYSNGEFITFLDDDDYFELDRFEIMVPHLSNSSREFGAIFSGYRYIKNEKKRRKHKVVIPENLILELLKTNFNIGSGSNFILKKEVFELVDGFDPSFLRHQDYEFLVRVAENFKFLSIQESLLNIQVDSNQQNKVDVKRLIKTKKQFMEKYSYLIKENEEEIKLSHLKNIIYNIFRNNEAKKYKNIFSYYFKYQPIPSGIFELTYLLITAKLL